MSWSQRMYWALMDRQPSSRVTRALCWLCDRVTDEEVREMSAELRRRHGLLNVSEADGRGGPVLVV